MEHVLDEGALSWLQSSVAMDIMPSMRAVVPSCRLVRIQSHCLTILLERNRHDDAVVGTEVLRDVTLAGQVLDERDVPGPDGDLLTSADRQLRAAAERDHILTAWADVPVARRSWRPAAELRARRLHHLGHAGVRELHRNLFRGARPVSRRIDACHRDRLWRLRMNLENPESHENRENFFHERLFSRGVYSTTVTARCVIEAVC